MAFGDTITPGDVIRKRVSKWLDNPPDYDDVKEAYTTLGRLRAEIRTLQRQIEQVEDDVALESDRPRSNDTRKAKLAATAELKNTLASLESKEKEVDAHIKWLEYQKVMYNAASFQSRIIYE